MVKSVEHCLSTMTNLRAQTLSQHSSIRTVTSKFPSSQSILDGSNLPFSVCITPLSDEFFDNEKASTIRSLTEIPKCVHCGAAHASSDTHYVVKIPLVEAANGENGDDYDDDMNDTIPIAFTYILICYLCARTTPLKYYKEQPSAITDDTHGTSSIKSDPQVSSSATFQLPLRLNQNRSEPTAPISTSSSKNQSRIPKLNQTMPKIPPVYVFDAISCPPLWFIVLDGSCTDRLYWITVSNVLQQCIRECPDHVHISLMISCTNRLVVEHESNTRNTRSNNTNASANENDGIADMEVHILGVFQLTSAIPYIVHVGSDESESTEEDLLLAVINSLVPATDAQYRNCIQAALRSLMDYQPPSAFFERGSNGVSTNSSCGHQFNCPVAWTTEVISAALQVAALPAGQRLPLTTSTVDNSTIDATQVGNNTMTVTKRLPYAGGKISYFLANRPTSVSNTSKSCTFLKKNIGGFGGRINNAIGERYNRSNGEQHGTSNKHRTITATNKQKLPQGMVDDSDLTPHNLWQRYDPEEGIVSYYSDLGRQCAELAIGVDILALTHGSSANENDNEYNSDLSIATTTVPDFGLSLMYPLSLKSGAPGPMIFEIGYKNNKDGHVKIASSTTNFTDNEQLLLREVRSRAPWQSNMAFGSELRIRFSQGFSVDSTPISPIPTSSKPSKMSISASRHRRNSSTTSNDVVSKTAPQLAPLYSESGMMGPGVSESEHLWRIGTCDPFTSVTMDLCIDSNVPIKEEVEIKGIGVVPFQPVIQTCFAYTTIVPVTEIPTATLAHSESSSTSRSNEQKKGRYVTVRRMRICSIPVPLAVDVESLYSSLNSDALAVTLFHKLALAVLQDGIQDAAALAQQWLQLFLKCVYRSAEEQQSLFEKLAEKGIDLASASIEDDDGVQVPQPTTFYPNERLLDRDGELGWEDVVLAQGQPRLKIVALLVYSLLQCDALRRHPPQYSVSLDLRISALLQLSSMTPMQLVRSVLPKIQLWESGEDIDRPVVDQLDLRTEAIQLSVMEYLLGSSFDVNTKKDLIIFINTPDHILVLDARSIIDTANNDVYTSDGRKNVTKNDATKPSLVIGIGLRLAIEEAVRQCRTKPTIVYDFDHQQQGDDKDKDNKAAILRRITDYLVEDTTCIALSLISGGAENFSEWRTYIAKSVRRQIDGST